MPELAIIGGTGLRNLAGLSIERRIVRRTPYGEPSGPLTIGRLQDQQLCFLPRHGPRHTIPPHRINYRANILALHEIGVKQIVAIAAVGGIRDDLQPGQLLLPDQLIDYTWGREHSFYNEGLKEVVHIDFTEPYSNSLRQRLLQAAQRVDVPLHDGGTYAATQGPRLETAAEIERLQRDGCDIVGMTGMPEAALARELDIDYACCAVIANAAAGKGDGPISMEAIELALEGGMESVKQVLLSLIAQS